MNQSVQKEEKQPIRMKNADQTQMCDLYFEVVNRVY